MNLKRIIILSIISILILALAIPFMIFGIRSKVIQEDYQYLLDGGRIADVKIEDVSLVKQDISCGYAIIEMLSEYYGAKVTEEDLYQKNNNSVSTASTAGFVKEINKVISGKDYKAKKYLKNDELLLAINASLLKGNPVAIEWAAKMEGQWTLHWSVVTGMDLEHIYINNPYGYKEVITYQEFLDRTSFKAFDNMPIGYYFGFAYGLFSKNTIIISGDNDE